jgi:hypothetical protein
MKRRKTRKPKTRPGIAPGPFVDQSSGEQFSDPSSSGEALPASYILSQDYSQWLYDNSGRDRVIEYAFSNVDGAFTTADGYFEIQRIVSSPVTSTERDYVTGQLTFLSQKLNLHFIESSFESADLRFFAASSDNTSSDGFATVGYPIVDIVWERLDYKDINGVIRRTISHEIGHALGLEHVDQMSGLSDQDIFLRWGISDSVMISSEKPYEYYNSQFKSSHQWFTKNDLDALALGWSNVA